MSDVATDRFEWTRRRQVLATVFSCGWLGYLVPVVEHLGDPRPLSLTVLSAAALFGFAACYVWLTWIAMRRPFQLAAPYPLIALMVLSGVLLWPLGADWATVFPFYLAALIPSQFPRRYWVPALAADLLTVVVLARVYGRPWSDLIVLTMSVAAVGVLVAMFFWILTLMVELKAARAELAQLAVAQERLRISRDLHDVLGHRLAAVVLKSDLAGRLVPVDPARAATEMAEAGQAAREALEEVRATVSGFREASLDGELSTARALLAAAEVDCVVSGPDHSLPRPVADLAGWVVREGVTNVVRHARARQVRITISTDDPAVVEVADDGRGATGTGWTRGNGLTGLAERVTAAGGTLTAAPSDGMFRLRALIPLEPAAAGCTAESAGTGAGPRVGRA